jgi:hypothetical protein
MTQFTLRLTIPNAGNKEIYYSVDLTGTYVSHPEDYFSSRTDGGKANRLKLIEATENQLLRKVTDEQLEQIIHKWNHGIKNGKSNTTTVEISLEPYGSNSNSAPTSPNYSNTTPPISQPITPSQTANYNHVSRRANEVKPEAIPKQKIPISQPGTQRSEPPNLHKNPPPDSPNETPTVDTWSTTNQFDF